MLTGQNGILNRAREAKEKTSLAQLEENEKISLMKEQIDNSISNKRENSVRIV